MFTQLQNNPALSFWKSALTMQLDQLDLAIEEWDKLEAHQLELIDKSWAPVADMLTSASKEDDENPAVAGARQAISHTRDMVHRSLTAHVALQRGARRMTRGMLKSLHNLAS